MSNRFKNKVAVITGAAQGIGKRVAEKMAKEKGVLVLVDRAEIVHEVAESLKKKTEVLSLTADLEKFADCQRVMDEAVKKFGRIDILINNVGGAIRMRPFAEFEPAQIDAEIRRSLMPTLYCCRAVLPHLLARGGGAIVNVSSNATRGIHRVPYSAAKGGVNAITQSLAMELAAQNIRVVATAPGGTEAPPRRIPRNAEGDSPDEQRWMAEVVTQVKQSAPMHRYGSIEEQAAPILFLASDEASYITGSVLPVAGGDTG